MRIDWARPGFCPTETYRSRWDYCRRCRSEHCHCDSCRAYEHESLKRYERIYQNHYVHKNRVVGASACTFMEFWFWLESHRDDKCCECDAVSTQTDHIQPLSRGGLHVISNLQRLCGPCNARKNAWLPGEKRHYGWDTA